MKWFIVALAATAALAPLPAGIVERWYSAGFYSRLQPVITATSSLVPFALLDVTVLVLASVAFIALFRRWRESPFRLWARQMVASVVVASAVVYLWFLLFWGLNYRRVPLEQKLAYDETRVSPEQALKIGWLAVEHVNRLAIYSRARPDDAALGDSLADVQRLLGVVPRTRVSSPKRSLLTWYFRKAAIDGMTDPFFLEIIVAPDLLPFERPNTLAHEWAHLAGYADESEANFIAWLTCVRAMPLARYSGWLAAYQHVSRVLPPEDQRALRRALNPAVTADLEAVNLRISRASPRISNAARDAYDTYLRANRIEEGIANYGAVVRLMLGTSFGSEWTPELRRIRP